MLTPLVTDFLRHIVETLEVYMEPISYFDSPFAIRLHYALYIFISLFVVWHCGPLVW